MQSRDELTKQRVKRLKIVLVMVSSYIAVEVIGGILTGSLALIADAGHMLADAGGIALALFAVSFTRKSPTPQQIYGFYRADTGDSCKLCSADVSFSLYLV